MTYVTTSFSAAEILPLRASLSTPTTPLISLQVRDIVQTQGQAMIRPCEILHGTALVTRHSRKWGEAVIDIIGPGALIGAPGLDGIGPRADCTITAATDLRLLPLAEENLPLVARRMSEELGRQQRRRLTLAQASALERVAAFLLQLSSPPCQRGMACNGCALLGQMVTIPVSRREMGSLLALTVETLSRCFAKLKQDQIIDLNTPSLVTVLNPRALMELGGDGDIGCPRLSG
ncbi:MAG: Crp/Fnr family transcriptional regulator [Acetobacteraceae bacterium]|nr:Crp/Fnr family transcriptional regulator [Acetobacteraceae bacterium]